MPSTNDSATTATPTSSDSRAPYTMRAHTSRPTSSVPSQWTRLGAASRPATSMCAGLPAISGASTPSATISAMRMAPSSVVRRRAKSVSQLGARAGRSAASAWDNAITLMRAGPSLVLHPRIDDQVREVHGQVDQHVHARDAEHHALDDRIVAPQHRGDDQPPQPGDVEHGLDHHRARDEDRERDADDGHRRDERVLEGVLVDDRALAQPLGPAGDDELLAQPVRHRRAG